MASHSSASAVRQALRRLAQRSSGVTDEVMGVRKEVLAASLSKTYKVCGKPNCRCTKKEDEFHLQFQLSVLWKGKHYTFHIPAEMAEEVRNKVEMHKQFQDLVANIFEINLRRLLRRKEGKETP